LTKQVFKSLKAHPRYSLTELQVSTVLSFIV